MKVLTKSFWNAKFNFAQAVWDGLKLITESVSLIVTSGATVYLVVHYELLLWIERFFLAAALVIMMRGSIEFMRNMAKMANTKSTYRAK